MAGRLKGKVAVITGSGRGIGKGIAMAMASEGAKVVINDLGGTVDGSGVSTKVADEVATEIRRMGAEAAANSDSVATSQGADNIIKTAINSFGRIDILVNNAGILKDRMLWNMTDEEWDAVIKTHLYGNFYCTRAAASAMRDAIKEGKQSSGRIINLSSHAGILGSPGQPNYSAAKMGIVGLTFSCAKALAAHGITCNAVAPLAMTRLTDTIPDDRLRQMAARSGYAGAETAPIEEIKKKWLGGAPEAVAPVACWLASDDAQNITGQVFVATEGRIGIFSHMQEEKLAFKEGVFTLDEAWRILPALTASVSSKAVGK